MTAEDGRKEALVHMENDSAFHTECGKRLKIIVYQKIMLDFLIYKIYDKGRL